MTTRTLILLFSLTVLSTPLHAESDRVLNGAKAEKKEIRHSMMGYRNTLLFYTFKDQQAILTVKIDNKDETFPVHGRVLLFDKGTTEKGLKKWINNQHSDGLFPDVPEPVSKVDLPKGVCTVTSHKQTGTSKNASPIRPGPYKDFEVKLALKEHVAKAFKLSAFADTARVHVPGK